MEMHTNIAETITPPMKQLMQMSTKAQTGNVSVPIGKLLVQELVLRHQIVPVCVPNTICGGKGHSHFKKNAIIAAANRGVVV